MMLELDQSVPATKKEAFAELLEIVKRLGTAAMVVDRDQAQLDSFRAAGLLGRLEMSAELGGFWKGETQ